MRKHLLLFLFSILIPTVIYAQPGENIILNGDFSVPDTIADKPFVHWLGEGQALEVDQNRFCQLMPMDEICQEVDITGEKGSGVYTLTFNAKVPNGYAKLVVSANAFISPDIPITSNSWEPIELPGADNPLSVGTHLSLCFTAKDAEVHIDDVSLVFLQGPQPTITPMPSGTPDLTTTPSKTSTVTNTPTNTPTITPTNTFTNTPLLTPGALDEQPKSVRINVAPKEVVISKESTSADTINYPVFTIKVIVKDQGGSPLKPLKDDQQLNVYMSFYNNEFSLTPSEDCETESTYCYAFDTASLAGYINFDRPGDYVCYFTAVFTNDEDSLPLQGYTQAFIKVIGDKQSYSAPNRKRSRIWREVYR